ITDILRGEEHISNTPRQMMVYDAFGWEAPRFGHMTLILNEERKNLRKGDKHVMQFIEQNVNQGFLPEALCNFITLLGWSPTGEKEIFNQTELIEIFDPERLSTSAAVFDQNKLKWMNGEYITKASKEKLIDITMPHLITSG